MNETWNTKGIVLFHVPYKDYDRLYTIYTEQFGKCVLRAQGIRKPKAKLLGSLEPFAEVDLFLIEAKYFNRIGGAVVTDRFRTLHTDLQKINASLFIVEVINKLCREGVKDEALYRLLYTTFVWLDHQSFQRLVIYSFIIKISALLGYTIAAEVQIPEIKKIIRWLETQEYNDIQRLRINQTQWNTLLQIIQTWLYTHIEIHTGSPHVQTEQFLV